MRNIPRKKVLERWDELSQALKDAMASSDNSQLVWTICELHHIPEDKRYDILTLVGDVMFGFIHAVDLSREIIEATGIPPKTADAIVEEINHKIFAPLRGDIEKAYTPHTKENASTLTSQAPETSSVGPAVVDLSAQSPFTPTEPTAAPAKEPVAKTYEPDKGPAIIHETIKSAPPIPSNRKPLGGFFGTLSQQQEKKSAPQPPPAAKVVHYTQQPQPTEMKPQPQSQPPQAAEGAPKPPPSSSLGNFPTPVREVIPPAPYAPKPTLPAVPASPPIIKTDKAEETKKPAQNGEDDLVDLRTFEKIKKQP